MNSVKGRITRKETCGAFTCYVPGLDGHVYACGPDQIPEPKHLKTTDSD